MRLSGWCVRKEGEEEPGRHGWTVKKQGLSCGLGGLRGWREGTRHQHGLSHQGIEYEGIRESLFWPKPIYLSVEFLPQSWGAQPLVMVNRELLPSSGRDRFLINVSNSPLSEPGHSTTLSQTFSRWDSVPEPLHKNPQTPEPSPTHCCL